MHHQGGINLAEAQARFQDHATLLDPATSEATWNRLAQDYEIDLVIADAEGDFHQRLEGDLAAYVRDCSPFQSRVICHYESDSTAYRME